MTSTKISAWQKRGFVSDEHVSAFRNTLDNDLLLLLKSRTPAERTIAATLLGQRSTSDAVIPLCDALQTETALYARLAICTALEIHGEASVPVLLQHLGKIGKNQEYALPESYFKKKSYPLARDIVARTLIRIGKPAVSATLDLADTPDIGLLSHVIDTLGGLLHRTHDPRIHAKILNLYATSNAHILLRWKAIRALSGHPSHDTTAALLPELRSEHPAMVWETLRTLGLTAAAHPDLITTLQTFTSSENGHIRLAAEDAIERLKLQHR